MNLLKNIARMIENGTETQFETTSRREWIKRAGIVSASGVLLVACGTDDDKKQKNKSAESSAVPPMDTTSGMTGSNIIADAKLLNAALALEHEAIAIYTGAAGLDFVKSAGPIFGIAATFLDHHKSHRDALIATINGMKEKNSKVDAPVEAKGDSDYLTPYVSKLTDLKNVLRLASLKEMEAAKAYLGLISSFKDPALAQTSGMLGGDEAGHYGALRAALFAVIQDSDVKPETVIVSAFPGGWAQTF
jgi:hypothetical protein